MIQTSETIDRLSVEAAILGSMALLPEALEFCAIELSGNEFSVSAHLVIFLAQCRMSERGIPVDGVTLAENLASTGDLERAGGFEGIRTILEAVFHAEHCRYYVNQLQQIHQRDSLRLLGERLIARAKDPSCELSGTTEAALNDLETLRAGNIRQNDLITAAEAIRLFEKTEESEELGSVVSSGLPDLDRALNGGFRAGQLIVIGGRPGLGKSSLMNQMVFAAGLQHRPGLIASLEMGAAEIAGRGLRKIPKQRFRELPVLFAECTEFQKLSSLVRLARRRHSIEFCAVDYLQLIESSSGRNEMRERQVAAMSRGLKCLARELQIPILLGSQLNRESEKRGRPSLADLRESGAIEQDADIVILINGDPESDARELIIAKHRGGPVGMVETKFDRPNFWFGDSEPWTGNL